MLQTLIDFWSQHSLRILDIVGTIVGLWYLWLEYRASINLWIVGIIMPAIYIFTYLEAKLYADFGLQIYYLLAAVYGWLSWRFGKQKNNNREVPVTHIPRKFLELSMVAFLILWTLISGILYRFTDSIVPFYDGFINALSVVALWMLARKYVDQWLVWMVVDIVSCALYIYKGIPFTAGLYGIYSVIAFFGYRKWLKLMRNDVIQKE
jgi:nicotinamide mononucleotide transporter